CPYYTVTGIRADLVVQQGLLPYRERGPRRPHPPAEPAGVCLNARCARRHARATVDDHGRADGRPVPQPLRLRKGDIHAAVRAGWLTGAGAVAVDVGAGAIMLAPPRVMQAVPRVERHPVLNPGGRVIVRRAR